MNTLRERLKLLQARSGGNWYSIRTAADKATIRIYDEISFWGVTAEDLANEIAAVTAPEIEVQINSPGGDVFDGLAIYNALRLHPARITTRVDGLAASAASFIVQAGDHRVIVKSAQMMIHEARGAIWGTADEMRAFADVVAQQNDVMAELYAERSGAELAHIVELMEAETWFTDQQAVDEGLVDELFTPARQDAKAAAGFRAAMDELAAFEWPLGAGTETTETTEPTEEELAHTDQVLETEWAREMFGS